MAGTEGKGYKDRNNLTAAIHHPHINNESGNGFPIPRSNPHPINDAAIKLMLPFHARLPPPSSAPLTCNLWPLNWLSIVQYYNIQNMSIKHYYM
jgi:hypothetical protein